MSAHSEYEWMDRAACRGTDEPNQFVYQLPGRQVGLRYHPDGTQTPIEKVETEEARLGRAATAADDFCTICPVRAQCLQFGMVNDFSGVFGGQLLFLGNPQLLPGVEAPKVEPRPCGTVGGWARHRQEGTKMCRACHLAKLNDTRRAAAEPCGTPAAYRNHYRRGEKPCQKCIRAESLRSRNRAANAAEPVESVAS